MPPVGPLASTHPDSAKISMRLSTSQSMAERASAVGTIGSGYARGLLDTSVVVDHEVIDHALLPDDSAISAVTLAELAAGPHATVMEDERARRQDRLQWASVTWDALPFDVEAARAYGRASPPTEWQGAVAARGWPTC